MTISITKANSKFYKLRSYDEAIHDLIYSRPCREAIKEELQHLNNYQIWQYKKFSSRKKIIGLK